MKAVVGFYILCTAMIYAVWLLFGSEFTTKETIVNATITQVFFTLIVLGSYLLDSV